MQTSNYVARNKKVAQNRGEDWIKSIKSGKLDARLRPSKLMITRVQKGLSQTVLAKALNISLSTYGGIERRKRAISEENIKKLENLLGLKSDKLFTRKNGLSLAL